MNSLRQFLLALGAFLLFGLFLECPDGATKPSNDSDTIVVPEGWELVWHDEFDGGEVDTANWTIVQRENSWNSELQYYVREDVYIENGCLRLRSQKRTFGSKNYTSGLVYTQYKFYFKYGRFEIRAKLPYGKGMWPAHWMLPNDGDWPPEIDIMENLGHQRNIIYMTNHYTEVGQRRSSGGYYTSNFDFSADFHTYAVEWEADSIRWYIDGVRRFVSTKGVPQEYFYIILNTAVGGDWPGSPDATTVFPQYHDIDYVRVFQRKR